MEKKLIDWSKVATDIQSSFPKLEAVYISRDKYVIVDFVNDDYDIQTMIGLKDYFNEFYSDNDIEILVRDFLDGDIEEILLEDAECLFNKIKVKDD